MDGCKRIAPEMIGFVILFVAFPERIAGVRPRFRDDLLSATFHVTISIKIKRTVKQTRLDQTRYESMPSREDVVEMIELGTRRKMKSPGDVSKLL